MINLIKRIIKWIKNEPDIIGCNDYYCACCHQWKERKRMHHIGHNAICIACEHLQIDVNEDFYGDREENNEL